MSRPSAKKCSKQEHTSESTLSGVSLDRVDAFKRRDDALNGQHVVETSEAKYHQYKVVILKGSIVSTFDLHQHKIHHVVSVSCMHYRMC